MRFVCLFWKCSFVFEKVAPSLVVCSLVNCQVSRTFVLHESCARSSETPWKDAGSRKQPVRPHAGLLPCCLDAWVERALSVSVLAPEKRVEGCLLGCSACQIT